MKVAPDYREYTSLTQVTCFLKAFFFVDSQGEEQLEVVDDHDDTLEAMKEGGPAPERDPHAEDQMFQEQPAAEQEPAVAEDEGAAAGDDGAAVEEGENLEDVVEGEAVVGAEDGGEGAEIAEGDDGDENEAEEAGEKHFLIVVYLFKYM